MSTIDKLLEFIIADYNMLKDFSYASIDSRGLTSNDIVIITIKNQTGENPKLTIIALWQLRGTENSTSRPIIGIIKIKPPKRA